MTLTTMIAELEEALKAAAPGPWRSQMDKKNHRCLIAFDDTYSKDLTLGAVWSSLHDEPPPNARLIALMRNSLPTLIEALKRQGEALEAISLVGGNMPDEQFETKTGPTDAMMRGGMFVTCRAIARAALTAHKEKPDV